MTHWAAAEMRYLKADSPVIGCQLEYQELLSK